MTWTDEELQDWLSFPFKPVYASSEHDAYEMRERYNQAFNNARDLLKNGKGMDVDRATQLLMQHMAPRHHPRWTEPELRKVVEDADAFNFHGKFRRDYIRHNLDAGVYIEEPREYVLPAVERIHLNWYEEPERTLAGNAVIRYMSNVDAEPINWLWPNRIALGKLTMIAGDPGLGKSFITLDLAARVSRGLDVSQVTNWPDGTTGPNGTVVLLSAEDDAADTIRPRLEAAGAKCFRIIQLRAVVERGTDRPFSLQRDLSNLESAIEHTGECKLVVIDPITAYLGSVDSHKNADVRALLAPLSDLASRKQVAIVAVSHLNKGQGQAIYRTMGSLAFVAAARAAYVVAKDQRDPTRRLFLPVKNNLGNDSTGLAYRIENGRVEWEANPITSSADEALAPEEQQRHESKRSVQRKEATDWLKAMLADCSIAALELKQLAKDEGISDVALRRAKDALGVTHKRSGNGAGSRVYWSLPT